MPDPSDRNILLTPGPTAVPPEVLAELAQPIIHHRTAAFKAIFSELCTQLQQVFCTTGPVLSIAGSGTTSFEAAQVSLATPGTPVIAVAGGKFGERWQDIFDAYAPALDLTPVRVDHDWGTPAPLDQLEATLKQHPRTSLVTVVHSETSTATASDVAAVARLVRDHAPDALLLVDGITSVGAMPVPMDDWGLDAVVSGSQKALMLPPGLGYVALGQRAVARLDSIDHDPPAYNLDLRRWLKSHAKSDVPFTPPVSLIRGQRVACSMILDQGLPAVHARTRGLAHATRQALTAMGLTLASHSPSDSVTGAYYPENVGDELRAAVRDRFGVHIAGGQAGRNGDWAKRVFRISHMGHVDADDTRTGLDAIATVMQDMNAPVDPKAGLAAFDQATA
jgi:aspartate aminotransferase-like enzyme